MRDLHLFRNSPRGGPSNSIIERAMASSCSVPQRVPSSKYHTFMRRPGTDSLIFSMTEWRTRAKPRGPRGSPCWTPQQLRIGRLSRRRLGWEPYEHSIQDVMEGRRDLTSWNMVARSIALEKSTSRVNLWSEGMLVSPWTLITECRMASQPPGSPTPTCDGDRNLRASGSTARAAHLEVSRRRTSPTAIGRRPPSFFLQGRREAPQRYGMTA